MKRLKYVDLDELEERMEDDNVKRMLRTTSKSFDPKKEFSPQMLKFYEEMKAKTKARAKAGG